MNLKPIRTEEQYDELLAWVDEQFDKNRKADSPQGEQLQIALLLIKQYEDQHYSIPVPDPIVAIKLKMEEKGVKNKDLVGIIGSKGYISSLLSGRKPLTLDVAKLFYRQLGLPAEIFLS